MIKDQSLVKSIWQVAQLKCECTRLKVVAKINHGTIGFLEAKNEITERQRKWDEYIKLNNESVRPRPLNAPYVPPPKATAAPYSPIEKAAIVTRRVVRGLMNPISVQSRP